ncbi:MAG: hypothetical protein JXA52_07680 [Planctomycetes bacterium]|nr:hypothetical protein [Planctomycetota bacterium]
MILKKVILFLGLLFFSHLSICLGQENEDRLPIPDIQAQKAAEAEIKDIFKREYASSRKQSERRALGRTLFAEAKEEEPGSASHFVLLREARRLAVSTGDLSTALAAGSKLSQLYCIDSMQAKENVLAYLGPRVSKAESEDLVKGCLSLAEEAIAADQYEIAENMAKTAMESARINKHLRLYQIAKARINEIVYLQEEFKQLSNANQTLVDKPDDPEANYIVGKFSCFIKGKWDEGLPLLAKGNNETLQQLAEQELSETLTSSERVEIAEAWFKLAEIQRKRRAKLQLTKQALRHYRAAVNELQGLEQTRVEKRIAECLENLPHVNLLKLVDPERDSRAGVWKFSGDKLESPERRAGRIELPYVAPEEYDLMLVFERKQRIRDWNVLFIGLVGGGNRFAVLIENGNFKLTAIDKDGNFQDATISKVPDKDFDQPVTIYCSVRKNRLTVLCNNEKVIEWEADYERVSLSSRYSTFPNEGTLFLISHYTIWHFDKIYLFPVTGSGSTVY